MRVPLMVFVLTTLALAAWHTVRFGREVLSGRLLTHSKEYTADCKEIWQDYLEANNGGTYGEDNSDRR